MAKPARNKSLRRVRTTKGGNFITLEEAERNAHKTPDDADAWRRLGVIQMRKGKLHDAIASLEKSEQLNPNEHNTLAWLGYTHTQLGNMAQAQEYLNRVLEENPQHLQALIGLVALQFHSGRNKPCLETLETAEALSPDNRELLEYKGQTFMRLARYEEALEVYHRIIEHNPDNMMAWNAAGVVYRDLGDFDKLVQYHKKAMSLDKNSSLPFSNLLTAVHYSPDWSRDEIAELCKEWQVRYAPRQPPARPVPSNLSPAKILRIGMFSDGFRSHPVGNMIIEAVERLHPEEVELYCYPTHSEEDHITQRFKKVAVKWLPIKHLPSDTFAQCVRDDGIDILIDMSGHNSGSRAYAVALQPAPLLVKWVGGLINTTGIEAIDYLLSDSIETPPEEEVDQRYVEKLVRLPDDYIVYHIPSNVPPVTLLPAADKGYITLGCFNNPTKLNDVTLKEWAKLMHELPGSRLFLKSKPYTSEALCERIYVTLEHEGITRERVLIEGPAQHLKLLETYGKVDIALDPWPYSGGLTTCEALLMGVPVVTLPGPTFAGRHSATHLVNAGLSELVVDNWEQYRERVVELASDLESLATIRTHLRDILKQSPVCDGARFTKHLMITLRAIWQRYCKGKAPEALTFNKDGQAWFKGESEPLDIVVQEVKSTQQKGGFNWEIQGQVVTIDNACKVLRDRALSLMIKSRAFAIIAFDPQSLVQKPEVYANSDNIQLFQHALLGDGQPATLHACMAPTLSSTLKPLPAEQLPADLRQPAKVLTQLPIQTIALNSIEGLESLDWLILDELSDAAIILENGDKALKDTLVLEVKVAFQRTHERQPSLDEISHWAVRHGFRFYNLGNMGHSSHFPKRDDLLKRQSTELVTVEALFIPNETRLSTMQNDQLMKLAFILHTAYGVRDLTFRLLSTINQELSENYLVSEHILPAKSATAKENNAVDVSNTSSFNDFLENTGGRKYSNKNTQLLFFPDYSHANPYQKLLYSIFPQNINIEPGVPWQYEGIEFENKIFHLHWEDIVYRQAKNNSQAKAMAECFIDKLRQSKATGWKIIWTIHNEAPHENLFPKVDKMFRESLASCSDVILVHSCKAKDLIVESHPVASEKITIIPNGSYEGFYPGDIKRKEARKKLGISDSCKVFLVFGNIRPYKGIENVLLAFSKESVQSHDCLLLIAGRGEFRESFNRNYTGANNKIKIFNYEIDDADVQSFFAASDFSVFGFKKILNSSSILLSYTFDTPIIIPDFESLDEFKGFEKGSLYYDQENTHGLEGAIVECCNMDAHAYKDLVENCSKVKSQYHWGNFVPRAKRMIEKTLDIGVEDESYNIGELTVLAFGRKASDVIDWKRNHQELISLGYRVVLAYSEDDIDAEIVRKRYGNTYISNSHDEVVFLRIKDALEDVKTRFVILCASDDKIRFTKGVDLEKISDGIIGYSGRVLFEDGKGSFYDSRTNALVISQNRVEDRLASYWTFPFPADNSVFYSILKLEELKLAMSNVGDASCEAWDWVLMTAFLKIGGIEKSDFIIERNKTPSINYTKNYIAQLSDLSDEKNPLDQAVERIKRILTRQQYNAISDKIDMWLEIKEREVKFIKNNNSTS